MFYHEIKRRLLLGRKVMTNLDSIFKSRDITLPTKVRLVKAIVFRLFLLQFSWVQSLSQCLTLCDPMNLSTPGLPVHHQLPEFTEAHVHWVSDAIQPSHPLSSPSPLDPNPSQHQSFPMSQLFAWGGQSIGVSASALVLPMNTQDWCRLEWAGWISLWFKGLARVFSNTTVQKHQFFGTQLSL